VIAREVLRLGERAQPRVARIVETGEAARDQTLAPRRRGELSGARRKCIRSAAAVPASEVAGTRYPGAMMAGLDSEK